MFVFVDNWAKCLEMLRDTYTIDVKTMCKTLKISRSWFDIYIKPNIDHIYLDSGKRGSSINSNDWVVKAAVYLKRYTMTANTWYNEEQFYEYLYSRVKSVSVQTRAIPRVCVIADQYIDDYKIHYNVCYENNDKSRKNKYLNRFRFYQFTTSISDNMYYSDLGKILAKSTNIVKRSETPFISLKLEDIGINNANDLKNCISDFCAPHDVKDYGDTDEMVYRKFFKYGYIKIVFEFPSKNRNTERVFYYLPNDRLPQKYNADLITISEKDYQMYKKWIKKIIDEI